MDIRAITVKQLNFYVKSLLEGDVHLQNVAVTGELSNFKSHYASGHLYFTLKDADAAIRCVMFRSFASHIPFVPKDGMQVVLIGRASVYEKDGQYQFYAEQMLPVGEGDLAREFERIKARLEAKGLFDPQNKRPVPKFPKKIAVITSETGAAVRDILNILSRRWPVTEVVMCPVSVQGTSAVPEMLDALDRIYRLHGIDLIIIGRGGGSAEDLNEFNSEALAVKISESPIPVISAVGHETDFSISDFVADLRAPTPSAAAELAVPDSEEIVKRLQKYDSLLKAALTGKYNYCLSRLEKAVSGVFKRPEDYIISVRAERADRAAEGLTNAFAFLLNKNETRLFTAAAGLDALSPLKVLSRGYAVAQKDGKTVKTAAELNTGDSINLKFTDGVAVCEVKEVESNI